MSDLDQSILSIESFEKKAQEFLETLITTEITKLFTDLPHAYIDHIAFRSASAQEYNDVTGIIRKSEKQKFFYESPVNGRPIAIIGYPMTYTDQIINALEIIAPKPNKESMFGFQHIEIVTEINENLSQLLQTITEKNSDRSLSKKENNQGSPEYTLTQKDTGYEITFHSTDIKDIIIKEINNTK